MRQVTLHGIRSERQKISKPVFESIRSKRQKMAEEEEAIKQAIAQPAVEADKAAVLMIIEEDRRQNMSARHSSISENTRHRT